MIQQLQALAMAAVDLWFSVWPQGRPEPERLAACRVISHRGEHDNRTVRENTLAAFRAARAAGVWGIEADIRWTGDLVPVIVHDPDGGRVFGDATPIAGLGFEELRRRLPEVPSLAELVEEFGGSVHLMLEIKNDYYPEPARQAAILAECLAGLRPADHYHFLALDPALFAHVSFAPAAACLPVAEVNTRRLSDLALAEGLGGLTGHFLLLNRAIQRRHQQAGQQVGTGFIRSRRSLYREINRGVAWVFSNHAARLQQFLVTETRG